ncbi:insulinase family protein [Pluralibacter gergoviae]
MQGTKIRLVAGGMLLLAAAGYVQAETLQPDQAWQQGTLTNGFQWQILATPQRPSDRIEIRLQINTGSLSENTQQTGFSHLLPRLALSQSGSLQATQARSLWQQSIAHQHPMPPATVSYDYTQFSLSLPNNRSDLLKEALTWLADTGGSLTITPAAVNRALSGEDPVATEPRDPKDGWWRYRLKGSGMLGHDPSDPVTRPVNIEQLQGFYHKWYTPDAMQLVIVGNIDSRSVSEQIGKTFGELKGKRETPAPMPTLSPLPAAPVSIMTDKVSQPRLAIMWDVPWTPIRDSAALERYWREDLAREALFWHIQQRLSKNNLKNTGLGFDCRVIWLRAQCGINLDSPYDSLNGNLALLGKALADVRDRGLQQEEFDALVAQKNLELQKLFATYARTDTSVLMSQRLRSLQNQVVDIAPEQYQKLREAFLNSLTLSMLNRDLRQQLSQDMSLVLHQPKGEPEFNMKELQATWDKELAPAADAKAPAADAGRQDVVSDIPAAQQ